MNKDPKKIVTPYAFGVSEHLLGKPLATPKRRFAALMLDLIIAAILSSLGKFVLAILVASLFFWISVRKTKGQLINRTWRMVSAGITALLIFGISLALIQDTEDEEKDLSNGEAVTANQPGDVNWKAFTEKAMSINYQDSTAGKQWEELGRELEQQMGVLKEEIVFSDSFPANTIQLLNHLASAIENKDTTRIDSLRTATAEILAAPELAELRYQQDQYLDRIDELEDENEDLTEKVQNPGVLMVLKATANDLGLALGWTGIYFTIMLVWLRGQTPGKKLLKLKVVRLNGKPLTLWYAFERTGGYAAGIATGLFGFFQVFWDVNRQGIHDKIAGTVVLDLRDKRAKKYQHLAGGHLDIEMSD